MRIMHPLKNCGFTPKGPGKSGLFVSEFIDSFVKNDTI